MNISETGKLIEVSNSDLNSRGYLLLLDCTSIYSIAEDAFDNCSLIKGVTVNHWDLDRILPLLPEPIKSIVIDSYFYEQDLINDELNAKTFKRSALINEIDGLLLLDKLTNLLIAPPVNRGLSFITSYLLHNVVKEREGSVKDEQKEKGETDNFEIFRAMLLDAASHIELNEVFFHRSIADNLFTTVLDAARRYIEISESKESPFKLQWEIDELLLWRTGICCNYASIAMYYALKQGIRPVDSLWLSLPNAVSGHNIIVLGLEKNADLSLLKETNSVIVDFWAGNIFPSSKLFSSPQTLQQYSDASITRRARVNPGQENHYELRMLTFSNLENPIEACKKVSQEILDVFFTRIFTFGEIQKSHDKNETLRVTEDSGGHIINTNSDSWNIDWNDDTRSQNIKDAQNKLNDYNCAATTIGKRLRFFTRKSSQTQEYSDLRPPSPVDAQPGL